MSQEIILIKLGGSVITHKEVPMMMRTKVLRRLIKEIAFAREKIDKTIIIGHGQGSFAHVPAMRYQTMDGLINDDSLIGMAITQDSAAKSNRIVVEECLAQELPAVSFVFSSTLVTNQKQAAHWSGEVLTEYLAKGLIPVTHGDVIVDQDQGCTIWSTETIFSFLVKWLQTKTNYQVKQVIHVNEVSGVLDSRGEVVSKINFENQKEIKKLMTKTKGFDVTGGMWHKIEESLKLAELGVETKIISGLEPDNLYQHLIGKSNSGTLITNAT